MGLTIHYGLKTTSTNIADVRCLVEALRQFALDLPFKEVGELVEFEGAEADHESSGKDDEYRWFKIQAGGNLSIGENFFEVKPLHIIGFQTWPGDGCEQANFGLCKYPSSIDLPKRVGKSKKQATKMDGWRMQSFCKTQYASDPKCGGVEHFLRCHLCIVKLLDFAKSTKLLDVEVQDESDYWEHRDLQKLANAVGSWNELIAGFSGLLMDAGKKGDVPVHSAIAGFPNFEHLEAKGRARAEKLLAELSKQQN
jgi:hypothetical protein